MLNPPMLTVKQAAQRLNVSASTVYGLVQSGQLTSHRVGVGRGVIRIGEADLVRYLQSCHAGVPERPRARTSQHRLKHIKL